MNDPVSLHREAMALADEAQHELHWGQATKARELFGRAFERELAAIEQMHDAPVLEQAVLIRSAAALGVEAQRFGAAERMIARGLLLDGAPNKILDEMRDLLEQVHFHRHLDLRGLVLDDTDVQMSIAGQAIGFGFANADEFVTRVNDFERILYRAAERRAGRPYREGGSPKKKLKESFEVYLSVPRAASFAVTLRLGRPKEQLEWSEIVGEPGVIAEALDLLEIAQARDMELLQKRIPEESYRRNFVALAKRMAPDGKNVAMVGFTTRRNGQERRVSLIHTRADLESLRLPEPSVAEVKAVEVRGFLKFADDTRAGDGRIKLVEASGKTHQIVVPEGMMTDIVRPLWDDEVVVRGELRGSEIRLDEIDSV